MEEIEKIRWAKIYLDKLSQGIDPVTNEKTSPTDIVNNSHIKNCFMYVSGVLEGIIVNNGRATRQHRLSFLITDEQKTKIEITEEPVGIMQFRKRIEAVLEDGVKSPPVTKMTAWLVDNGYLQEIVRGNKKSKIAAVKGETIGIVTVDGVNAQGIEFKKNLYGDKAQKLLIDNLENMANYDTDKSL